MADFIVSNANDSGAGSLRDAIGQANASVPSQAIAFIATDIPEWQSLVKGVKPDARVVVLDSNRDGVEQITDALIGGKYSAVHIVSHGSEGSLRLGNSQLNLNNLSKSKVKQWANSLTEDADILLYGCDVASGKTGELFLQRLKEITGADIAASSDKTGNAALGGNWILEKTTGSIETPLIFKPHVLAAYQGILTPKDTSVSLGGTGYVSVPNSSVFDIATGRLTVEAWIKVNSFNVAYQTIIAKGDTAWRIARAVSTDKIEFGIGEGPTIKTVVSNASFNDGQWHHVAGVYDGSAMRLYIDGNLDAQTSGSGPIDTNPYTVYIGENSQYPGRQFNGLIDEVRVWNVARTQGEIQASMNQSLSPTPGLVGYWQFDEGSGTTAVDASGNGNNATLNSARWLDNGSPTIASVSSTLADGAYGVGQVIPIAVAFSEVVNVTGTPTLTLNTGGTATYASGSSTTNLVFNYTVAAGHNTADLDYANPTALTLNGGAIRDLTNNNANLTLPTPGAASSLGGSKNIAIDTPAAIASISSPTANGTYSVGQVIPVAVTFSETVNVTGTPTLALNTGGTATYASGSGSNTLTFNYTVATGQNTTDLDYASTTALTLSGGTIKDITNNNAALTLPTPSTAASLGGSKNIAIDTASPAIASISSPTANGTYSVGQVIPVAVTFSEAVNVTGTPTLALNTGGTATYASGSGSNTITFNYTVAAGQTAADLDYTSTAALVLSGGTIQDSANNNAALTLPTPGTAASLGGSKDIAIVPEINNNSASELAEGIDTSLSSLRDSLSQLLPSDIPIVGDKLTTVIPEFLNTIKDKLTIGLRVGKSVNDSQIEGIFKTSLGGDFPDLQVKANVGVNETTFQINLTKEYNKDLPLSADLGLPALGLKTDGAGKGNFKYDLSLGLGYNRQKGFFLDTKNTAIELNAGVSLDNAFAAKANLGFLQLDLQNNPSNSTKLGANLTFGIKDSGRGADNDSKLTLTEIKSAPQKSKLFATTLGTTANVGLGAKTSINGSAVIPSFNFDLNAGFSPLSYKDGQWSGTKKPKLAFNNMQLDLGTFITDFAKPVITKVDEVVRPARPVIDALNSDIKPLSEFGAIRDFFDSNQNGRVTLIEAGATIAGKQVDTRFLDAVQAIGKASQLLRELGSQDGNIKIDLGDYELDFDATDARTDTKTAGKRTTKSPGASSTEQAKSKSKGKASEFLSTLQNMPGLSFPILSNPATAVDLLLGKPDVTLFAYQVPKLDFNFGIDKEFPIYSIPVVNVGVNGKVEGSFEAKANFGFGFDTSGLSQWKQSGFNASDAYRVFDGFYVSDRKNADGTGDDVSELKLKGRIAVGGGVNIAVAKAYLTGGIEANANLDLLDAGEGDLPPDANKQAVLKAASSFGVGLSDDLANNIGQAINFNSGSSVFANLNFLVQLSQRGLENRIPSALKGPTFLSKAIEERNNMRGTGDGKIRASEIISRISNPLNLFEINGDVKAALDFKAEYYRLVDWKTAFEKRLGEIKLADFRIGTGSTRRSRAIDGYITGGKVFFDANFNEVREENEPISFTNPDGSFDITIELEKFDTNKNGQIDRSEGKFVLNGGIDIATYLPLDTPLYSTPESTVVTPLTTLIADLVERATDPQAAETQIKSALNLPANVDLASFDPLEAIANNDANGVTVYASMIQVQNTIVQMAKFTDGASDASLTQLAQAGIAAIADRVKGGTPVDLSQPETIVAILQDAIAKAAESDPNINPSQLSTVASAAAQVIALGNQIVQELAASGRPLKDIALEITRSQAVSVGQIAVGLPELAAGTKTIDQFLAENTRAAIEQRIAQVHVNDPTFRPAIEANTPAPLANGSGVSVDNFNNMQVKGSAAVADNGLSLTSDTNSQSGGAFVADPVKVGTNSYFSTRFQFQIQGTQGNLGADGFVFALQSAAADVKSVNWAGGYLGYYNPNTTTRSLAVEFDTHQNEWDTDDNHVAVLRDGSVTNHLAQTAPSIDMSSGTLTSAWVEYERGTLRVFLSQSDTKPTDALLSYNIDLPATVGEEAFVSFTGATGDLRNSQDIRSGQYTQGNIIDGSSENDFLAPNGLNDKLFGYEGDDILGAGTAGGGILTGGGGADTFRLVDNGVVPGQVTTIADFQVGVDMMAIASIAGVTDVSNLSLTQNGADTLIRVNDTDLAVLSGIQSGTLNNSSFVFA